MNKYELYNTIKERLHNQLRIHWKWMRQQEDYKQAFNLIEAWMNDVATNDLSSTLSAPEKITQYQCVLCKTKGDFHAFRGASEDGSYLKCFMCGSRSVIKFNAENTKNEVNSPHGDTKYLNEAKANLSQGNVLKSESEDIHSQNKELIDKDYPMRDMFPEYKRKYRKDKQKGTDGGNDGK